jgi:hypothetical protein
MRKCNGARTMMLPYRGKLPLGKASGTAQMSEGAFQ